MRRRAPSWGPLSHRMRTPRTSGSPACGTLELLAPVQRGALAAAARSERALGGVDAAPTVQPHRRDPRSASSGTTPSPPFGVTPWRSVSSEATVAAVSFLLVPTIPVGPRLPQDVDEGTAQGVGVIDIDDGAEEADQALVLRDPDEAMVDRSAAGSRRHRRRRRPPPSTEPVGGVDPARAVVRPLHDDGGVDAVGALELVRPGVPKSRWVCSCAPVERAGPLLEDPRVACHQRASTSAALTGSRSRSCGSSTTTSTSSSSPSSRAP